MSTKGRMLSWLGGWVLRELKVRAVEELGDLRWVSLEGELPGLQPGDKIQALVGEDEVRTWTPIVADGGVALLVYVREAESPGMRWIRAIRPGDRLRAVGPQRSLRAPGGPAVLVGDETSVAVAAALAAGGDVQVVLEVASPEGVRPALLRAGLERATLLARPAPEGALLAAMQAAGSERSVLLTGGAALVQRARAELRAAGRAPGALKTYWVEGRAGLD